MRKVKHFAGYGTVKMGRIKDGAARLHVRVQGNHERGLSSPYMDAYDVFEWIVSRFDKSIPDAVAFRRLDPSWRTEEGYTREDGLDVDTCDYYINY